jgi:hypothetical protein
MVTRNNAFACLLESPPEYFAIQSCIRMMRRPHLPLTWTRGYYRICVRLIR